MELERGGENYLIPVDAKLENDIDLEYEAITLSSTLLAVMQAKKLRLVVLDACRTNPFGEKMKTSLGLTRAVAQGLARVEPHGDILVAYSAKAGTVAFDGEGPLSPYATAMLKHIEHPGLDVRLLMGKVRDDVMVATARKQEPFIYGSLSGDIIPLVPAPAGASGEAAQSLLVAEEKKEGGRCRSATKVGRSTGRRNEVKSPQRGRGECQTRKIGGSGRQRPPERRRKSERSKTALPKRGGGGACRRSAGARRASRKIGRGGRAEHEKTRRRRLDR